MRRRVMRNLSASSFNWVDKKIMMKIPLLQMKQMLMYGPPRNEMSLLLLVLIMMTLLGQHQRSPRFKIATPK